MYKNNVRKTVKFTILYIENIKWRINMVINNNDIPDDALNILAKINNVSEGYLVGGCVRDLLLGKQPHDFDITTKLHPNEIIKLLTDNGYYCYGKGIEYGTVVAVGKNNEEFEVTTSDNSYIFFNRSACDSNLNVQ